MVNYLVMQIKKGNLDYDKVIAKYPQFKDAIDELLK